MSLTQPESAVKTAWGTKFAECLLAAVAITNFVGIIFELLPRAVLSSIESWFELFVFYFQTLLPLLIAIICSILWQRKQNVGFNSAARHARLRGIIRFWLAFEIASYGFAKIMGTQFSTPIYRLDVPMGQVSGFGLTWYYFGYSRALAVIIAFFQIGGSIMLLFRRTTLLGAILLLPVMINILFINLFFKIASGALMNSVLFTISLCYLVWLDRYLLARLLSRSYQGLPRVIKPVPQWILRILVIVLAAGFIYSFLLTERTEKTLSGKWLVQSYTRGTDSIGADQWLHDSTAWKVLYFNGTGGQAAFCPNPYVYEMAKSSRGEYDYDPKSKNISVVFYDPVSDKPADSIKGTATVVNDTSLIIKGTLSAKPVEIKAILKKKG